MTDNNDLFDVDESATFNFGDQAVGLASFMDIDTTNVEANEGGFKILPQGVYEFRTDAVQVTTVARRNKDTGEEFQVPQVRLSFNIESVVTTSGDDVDEASLIGRKHTEFIAIPTFDQEQATKAIGRLKAFAIKMSGSDKDKSYPTVKDILADIVDKPFTAKIKHGSYTNKDGDKVVTEDFDVKSIKAA